MRFAYKGKMAEITITADIRTARAIQAATTGDDPIIEPRRVEDSMLKDIVGVIKRVLIEKNMAPDKSAAADMVRSWGMGTRKP